MKTKLQQHSKFQQDKTDFETNSELNAEFRAVFKNASKTYFYSSLFFPKKIRQEINILYAFVRTADDFVDSIPANSVGFFAFKNYYLQNSKVSSKSKNCEQISPISPISPNLQLNFDQTKFTKADQNVDKSKQTKNVEKSKENPNLEILEIKTKIENKNHANLKEKSHNSNQKLEFWQKIVLAFVDLEERLEFEKSWTLAFLESMESDLSVQIYPTINETCKYIYGSANVIGFFMAKILKLPPESYEYAGFLGQSFQYINFVRDIAEDLELGRCYFPQELLRECNLQSLKLTETRQKPEEFAKFVKICLNQYKIWQTEAEKGFKFFPKKYKIAIKTASDMYKWTAKIIAKDPFIVYQKKIKPQKRRVLFTGLINCLT